MNRREMLGAIACLLMPASALAQSPAMPPADGATGQRRPGPAMMTFEEMNPRQRQLVGRVLAGHGNPALPEDRAAAQWNGMTVMQRRQAMRAFRDARRAAGETTPRAQARSSATAGGAMPPGAAAFGATMPPRAGAPAGTIPPMPATPR